MKHTTPQMKPQDVIVILRILKEHGEMTQTKLARSLFMSQSEISQSLARSRYAGLLSGSGQEVMRALFMDFLHFGIQVVFPAKPGQWARGVPTAHSASPLLEEFNSGEIYVWPWAKGESRGQSIPPLYPSIPQAAMVDPELHEWFSLVDALRVGRTRERNLAIQMLEARMT